jgi:YD repeat-containing protein
VIAASASVIGFGAGDGNVVSANGGDGVRVSSPSTSRSTIRDNFIGTDSTGMLDRGNGMYGVEILGGGATGGAALGLNVISGNTLFGVRVASGDGNISTSKIGLNTAATAAIPNQGGGVWVDNAVTLTITSCTISGNAGPGVKVSGASADAITLTGNAIGLNGPGGGVDLGNTGHGIEISGGAEHAVIGSANLDSNINEIRFNGGNGINADSCNRILFNKIFGNESDAFGGGGFFNPGSITITLTATQFPDQKDVMIMVDDPQHPSTDETFIVNLSAAAGANAQQPIGSKLLTTDGNGHASGTVRLTGPFETLPAVTVFGVTDATSTPNTSCTSLIEEVAGGPPPTITANTTGNQVSSGNTNDPINTFTGELFGIESVDLELRGPMPLLFVRYHASKIASDGQITSALGRNRLHNFDAKLTVAGTNATAVLSSGRVVQFTKTGNVWTQSGRADIVFQLVESGGTFLLAEVRTQTLWTFDASGKLTKREDGRGNAHTFTYDGSDRLATVSDGLGRTLTFTNNGAGKLTSVGDGTRTVNFAYTGDDLTSSTDALNRTTTYSYDALGNLLSIARPRGNTPVTQTYDASGKVISQIEHPASGDQTTAIAYDAGTRRTTIADATTATRVHEHTESGELSEFKDESGATITIGSDATGRRSAITDRLGRTTTIGYHAPSGLPASITTADGATTKFVYKARVLRGITFYDLVKITYADGASRSFTYDGKGNLATSTDQLGEKTKFTYDARGQLITATDPARGVATFTYDATTGNLLTSKDSDTGATTYAYDAFSRLVKITYADDTDVDITYDAADRITSVTDERNQLFSFGYDANDNLLTITDPTGITQFGYDALDRVTQVTDRLLQTVRRTFNSRDQLATVTDELNHTLTLGYDSRRRLANITEPVNATVSFGYDAEGALTSVTDALAHIRHYTRNKLDRLITASDALGNTAQIGRDELQRVTNFIDPIGRQTKWAYDKRGQLIGAGRDGAVDATYVRDAAGRLMKITDPNSAAWSYSYTPAGRMLASKDPLGRATRFAYDTRGRLQKITLPEGGECTIQRDAASNVTGLVFPNNDPNLQFTYDPLGRVLTAAGVTLTPRRRRADYQRTCGRVQFFRELRRGRPARECRLRRCGGGHLHLRCQRSAYRGHGQCLGRDGRIQLRRRRSLNVGHALERRHDHAHLRRRRPPHAQPGRRLSRPQIYVRCRERTPGDRLHRAAAAGSHCRGEAV